LPNDIVSDRDVLFTSLAWPQFCTANKIEQSMSSAYHPQTDGQSEVANKNILAILRAKLLDEGKDWIGSLPSVHISINYSYNKAIGCTPHSLVFHTYPRIERAVVVNTPAPRPEGLTQAMWEAVQTRLRESCRQMAMQANKRRGSSPEYQVGDLSKISSSCFPIMTQFNKQQPIYMR